VRLCLHACYITLNVFREVVLDIHIQSTCGLPLVCPNAGSESVLIRPQVAGGVVLRIGEVTHL